MKFKNIADMKTIRYPLILALGAILFASCESYLDKTPEATVTEEDIFGTYQSFQGFVDVNYGEVINYNTTYPTTSNNIGGETLNNFISWSMASRTWNGDYWYIAGATDYSFNDFTSNFMNGKYGYGIYYDSDGGKGGGGIWTRTRKSK